MRILTASLALLLLVVLVHTSCLTPPPQVHDVCREHPDNARCGVTCATDGECGPALHCGDAGKCVAECVVGSADCGTGLRCEVHGRCVAGIPIDLGPPCVGLQCQQIVCPGGGTTSVSGTVSDPAGSVPLYNVVVYVPNAPVAALSSGASCDKCGSTLSGSPIATALTDTSGHFKLANVPVGSSIPLVIQVGKWRRQLVVPTVTACADTPLTDAGATRLPRSQAEGDLPRIALTTGGADALECLLRKIGIADSEFTPPTGTGHVHLYAGAGGTDKYAATMNGGASFGGVTSFWGDLAQLKKYDVVVLSCESSPHAEEKPAATLQAMFDYASAGGRIFASHYHNYWFQSGPAPFPTVAAFTDLADIGDFTADIDTTFPKGMALADWLVKVGGSTTMGKVAIKAAQHTINATNNPPAQRWIYSSTPMSTQYLSFNTPIGVAADQQCGRVVLSDIHVSSGDSSAPAKPYPSGCVTTTLSAQEKVLEFMLFDLSSCVLKDDKPPEAPPIL